MRVRGDGQQYACTVKTSECSARMCCHMTHGVYTVSFDCHGDVSFNITCVPADTLIAGEVVATNVAALWAWACSPCVTHLTDTQGQSL